MAFQVSVSIGYKDIFDDFETVDVSQLISDISTKNSLEIVTYFLAQIHTLESDPSTQYKTVVMWASRFPEDVRKSINDYINRVIKKPNADFNFINNISGLLLIEHIIKLKNDLEPVKDLTPEQELNLFKAYLYCSQLWTDKQSFKREKNGISSEIDLIKILLPSQLAYQEILEFKDFRIQFIKAIYFFKFCESNIQFKQYLNIFLQEYNLKSWQKYLVNLLSIYIRNFEKLKTPSVLSVPDEFPDIIGFLEDLSIDTNAFNKSDDFLSIREKPVYSVSRNEYIFLNLNFLVDKLYQGIQFDFAKILVKNKATYNGKPIKSPVAFMSIFGNEFSETGLFYSVMDHAFAKSKYIRLNGRKLKKQLVDAEPDYYMRDKAKVYIFEYKNVYLGAPIKHSNDYEIIKSEVFRKLVENENNSAKGVTQLINTIEKIKKGDFQKIDSFDFTSAIIYPVIIYVDFSFNLAGMNYLLNKEFRRQINQKGIAGNVKDLILIDIDSFIKFQDLFRNGQLKINNCFNGFYEHINFSSDLFNRISTFNIYIHDKTRKMKYGSPKMLMDELSKMLPGDEDLNIERV